MDKLRHSMKLASSDAKETEKKPDKRTDVVQMGLEASGGGAHHRGRDYLRAREQLPPP